MGSVGALLHPRLQLAALDPVLVAHSHGGELDLKSRDENLCLHLSPSI